MTAGLTAVRAAHQGPTADARAAPTSLDELLAWSGQVALDLSGADRSAWTGHVVETSGSILGLAHWDGTLYLDRECILDPLEQLYEHAGEQQSIPVLVSYRESLATLLHEHAHFLGPAGATQEDARQAFVQPGSRQLEEGVAEAWAQDHLDEYIARLGIDKVAPGIEKVEAGGYYSAFVPAVRRLTTDLEARSELYPGQVLDVLNRETAAGQFPLLVSIVYNSTQLPELESAGADTRNHLEALLRRGLEHLTAYEADPSDHAAAKSRSAANQLLQHLSHAIHTAESTFTPDPTACALPPPPPITPIRLIPGNREPTPIQTALSGVTPPQLLPTSAGTVSPPTARTPGREGGIRRGA
ncbi:hypothetical protein [Kribbella sp. NPDC055071]